MMSDTLETFLWIGSELGLIKRFCVQDKIVQNYTDETELRLSKINSPSVINWANDVEDEILIGTKIGRIKKFKIEKSTFEDEFAYSIASPIVGLNYYNDYTVSCTEKGNLLISRKEEKISENVVGDHIQKMKQNKSDRQFVAIGGKENNLKLFDLENIQKPLFVAKNVRNDMLDLRKPVWVTDIDFLKCEGINSRIVTGNGDHTIKVYDPRKQRRPVIDFSWHEYPVTAISVSNDDNIVIVGNTAGYMASIDLRKCDQIGAFKGIAGSIRSIQCHQSQNFVACCGLDRFLRVYDNTSRKTIVKAYLKSRLNCVLLSDNEYKKEVVSHSHVDVKNEEKLTLDDDRNKMINEELDDDSIWNKMKKATDKRKNKSTADEKQEKAAMKKKRKINIDEKVLS